jgi:hypothetical protein
MIWRKDFNAWATRKLGWYGAFMATAVCLVILTCGIAALALQTGPRELFVPGLLAIAVFAAAGPFFWVANKEPGRIHIRPALAGMAMVMLCGPLTLFYSALRLGLIGAETFHGYVVTIAVAAPFVMVIAYFTIRLQLKGKKELV